MNGCMQMGKGSGSDVGTGGMATKLSAARIATASGADMIIANGEDFPCYSPAAGWSGISELYLSDIWMRIFDLVDALEEDRMTRIWPCDR